MSRYISFDKPATVREAKKRIAILRSGMLDMEATLGDRDRRGVDTVRLSPMEFNKWRQRVKWAMRNRGKEIGYLQEWIDIRECNREEGAYRRMKLDPNCPESLLAAAYKVLRCLVRERRVTLDEEEQLVIDATSRYFGPIVQANGKVVPPKELAVIGGEDEPDQTPPL